MGQTHWTFVNSDTGGELTARWQGYYGGEDRREGLMSEADRLTALREFRETGSIRLGVLVDPSDYSGPEADEQICAAGPEPTDIDWTGFPG